MGMCHCCSLCTGLQVHDDAKVCLKFYFYHTRVNVRFYVDHSHASVSFDYNNINFVGNNSTDKNADKPNIMLRIQCIWKVYTALHLFPFLSCYFFVLKWIHFPPQYPKNGKVKKGCLKCFVNA